MIIVKRIDVVMYDDSLSSSLIPQVKPIKRRSPTFIPRENVVMNRVSRETTAAAIPIASGLTKSEAISQKKKPRKLKNNAPR